MILSIEPVATQRSAKSDSLPERVTNSCHLEKSLANTRSLDDSVVRRRMPESARLLSHDADGILGLLPRGERFSCGGYPCNGGCVVFPQNEERHGRSEIVGCARRAGTRPALILERTRWMARRRFVGPWQMPGAATMYLPKRYAHASS